MLDVLGAAIDFMMTHGATFGVFGLIGFLVAKHRSENKAADWELADQKSRIDNACMLMDHMRERNEALLRENEILRAELERARDEAAPSNERVFAASGIRGYR